MQIQNGIGIAVVQPVHDEKEKVRKGFLFIYYTLHHSTASRIVREIREIKRNSVPDNRLKLSERVLMS